MPRIVNFSDAATIGIHSAILIAKVDRPVNAIELSEETGFSKHHIGKVLQRLVKDGIFTSFRGPSGGFMLKKNPADITIYDIYRSIEGEVEIEGCSEEHHICPMEKCIRDNLIKKMSADFVRYLKENTIADYM